MEQHATQPAHFSVQGLRTVYRFLPRDAHMHSAVSAVGTRDVSICPSAQCSSFLLYRNGGNYYQAVNAER